MGRWNAAVKDEEIHLTCLDCGWDEYHEGNLTDATELAEIMDHRVTGCQGFSVVYSCNVIFK